jgi:polyadenylate-binding protein 2
LDHDSLSIYIGNVDYGATEDELKNTFIDCGDIVRVTIIKNMKTGHPKGAAFIEFTDKEGVNAALNMNGKPVKGIYKNLNFISFK